jgi:hypothetical protein
MLRPVAARLLKYKMQRRRLTRNLAVLLNTPGEMRRRKYRHFRVRFEEHGGCQGKSSEKTAACI